MRPAFLIAAATFALLAGCATPTQYRLDRKVEELCAVDGGIKVYETVTLPASKFNVYGQLNFFKPIQRENALGPDYRYHRERRYLVEGTEYGERPSLIRIESKVWRRSDDKLLGQFIYYTRWGGDLFNPGIPSGKTCPKGLTSHDFFGQLFHKDEAKE